MRKRTFLRGLAVAAIFTLFGCSHSSGPSPVASTSASSSPSAANSSSNPATTSSAASSSGSSSSPAPNNASNTPAAAPAPPPPLVVPAGRTLTVTVDQDVSTKTNSSGDSFAASLAEPVTVDGKTAFPSGAHVTGTIVEAQSAGHIKGGAVLTLTLDSVRVDGQKFSVHTSDFEESGRGRGKRTAIGGGGGAAFGAIIGAIAGGGKGAALGALAGGGAGTAGAAFTGKRDITIPAETRLHFKLKDSISIPQQ